MYPRKLEHGPLFRCTMGFSLEEFESVALGVETRGNRLNVDAFSSRYDACLRYVEDMLARGFYKGSIRVLQGFYKHAIRVR